jgi:hypothetical protein
MLKLAARLAFCENRKSTIDVGKSGLIMTLKALEGGE